LAAQYAAHPQEQGMTTDRADVHEIGPSAVVVGGEQIVDERAPGAAARPG
jgi:hypothetical protein